MKKRWVKEGLVFCPSGKTYAWMRTHAANPTPELLPNGRVRIFFSTRDENNRSSIAYLEISPSAPQKILKLSEKPVLSHGPAGLFDDSGVSVACQVQAGRKKLLYYLGWNLGVTVPFRNAIGLAVSTDGGKSYRKYSQAPILDRSSVDPYSLSYPFVMRQSKVFRMWYGSNLGWGTQHSDMKHVIKYAESPDGLCFSRQGRICVRYKKPGEFAVSRPWIFRDRDGYHMVFSRRSEHYRLGYAFSNDGLRWSTLRHAPVPEPSGSGWESEAVCYASLFEWNGSRYMLYNGNSYGKTGFGIARWT